MKTRIKQLRDQRKWRQEDLAEMMGIHTVSLSRLETGKTKVSEKRLRQLMEIFNVTAAEIFEKPISSPSFQTIKVVGAVEAGALKEAITWEEDQQYTIAVPLADIYKLVKPFALEVRGPSMNKLYREGSILVCASPYQLNEDLRNGKRYVIERILPDGQHEATVKTVRLDDKQQIWLWPESDHPEFQTPTKIDGKDGEEIRVMARVLGVYQMED